MDKENHKIVFAKNLKEHMDRRGKTQSDIVNDLDINQSTISSWMNGERFPRMDKVDALAAYLNCTRSDLIEDSPFSSYSSDYFEVMRMYTMLSDANKELVKNLLRSLQP